MKEIRVPNSIVFFTITICLILEFTLHDFLPVQPTIADLLSIGWWASSAAW